MRLQICLVIALLSAGAWWLWWSGSHEPAREDLAALQSQEQQILGANRAARRAVAELGVDAMQDALDSYAQLAEQARRLAPDDTVSAQLLPHLTDAAGRLGVGLSGITPEAPGVYHGYATEGYSLTVSGSYHDVGAFLAEALSMDRITQIRGASVRSAATRADLSSGVADSAWPVEATLSLITFSTPTGDAASVEEEDE